MKRILGICTTTPFWDDAFIKSGITNKQIIIFDETINNKRNKKYHKVYYYPSILNEDFKKFRHQEFIKIYKNVLKNFLIYNNNLSRFLPNFNHLNLNKRFFLIESLIRKLIQMVLTNKFSMIISASGPHRLYDQILRDIANEQSIKFIYPDNTYFEEIGCMVSKADDLYKQNKKNSKNKLKLMRHIDSEIKYFNSFTKNEIFKKRNPVENKALFPQNKQSIIKKIFLLFKINESVNPITFKNNKIKKTSFLKIYFFNRVNRINLINAKKFYRKNCTEHKKLLKNKFVYFAPCYQPERTTNPDGGIFYEHYYAISNLEKFLPEDMTIIYKEHPKCFDTRFKNIKYRDIYYYKKLLQIKKLKFIKENFSQKQLIKKSLFVSGINGTTGHESYFFKKCYLLFGESTFKNYPNVIKYSGKNSIKNAINFKFNQQSIINFKRIKEKFSNLYFIYDYWRYNSNIRYNTNFNTNQNDTLNMISKDIKRIYKNLKL